MRYCFDWTIERGEILYNIEIEGSFRHSSPATGPTYSSGGEPAEPDEFEIEVVTYQENPFELTEAEEDKIYEWVFDNPPEPYDDYDY